MTKTRILAAAAAMLSLCGAQARAASCWNNQTIEAAQVRDFETMLMVSMLRCRIGAKDMTADYNRFVIEKKAALVAAADEMRAQFNRDMGGRAALDAFDRYMTSIANSYGAGVQAQSCEDVQLWLQQANAAETTRAALVALAQRAGADPALPGGRCPVTIAMAK